MAQRQGAKAVMATLWSAGDQSTARLMQEFYKSYQSGSQMAKAEALRQAQLGLLTGKTKLETGPVQRTKPVPSKRVKGTVSEYKTDTQKPYSHPYYWAPFILIGNWQ